MRRLWILWIAAVVAAPPAAAAAAGWEPIEKLVGHTSVPVRIGKEKRVYFRLTPQTPLVVPLEGPARLRVISRVELAAGGPAVVSYRLRATSEGGALDELSTESSASSHARLADKRAPVGKSRRLVVRVPAGPHRVTLSLEGAPSVLVRLMRGAARDDAEALVPLTPVAAPRSVSVVEGERSVPYYSVLPGRPVKLRVVGPTTLDLTARLDFDSTMHGVQTYRLGLSENGRRLRTLDFRTTRASTARYAELNDRLPSKQDRARVPVGEGVHELKVELLQPEQGAAEVRVRIPQTTAGNAE